MKKLNLLILIGGAAFGSVAHAQIFEVNQGGSIGEYNLNGTAINAALVSGITGGGLDGLAVEATATGDDLFVSNTANGNISEYILSGGTVSGPTLIGSVPSGNPTSLAITGSTLYVADDDTGNVLAYNLSGTTPVQSTVVTGQGTFSPRSLALNGSDLYLTDTNNTGAVNEYVPGSGTSSVLSNLAYPIALAVSGNTLYVGNNNNSSVAKYTLSGANDSTATLVSSFSITGLGNPSALAVDGNDLLVSSYNNGTIKAYSTTTGALDTAFNAITGLSNPEEIDVLSVPEPTSWSLVFGAAGLGWILRRLRAILS